MEWQRSRSRWKLKASRDEMDQIIRRTGKIKEVKYRTSASGITTPSRLRQKAGKISEKSYSLHFPHADVPMLTLNQSKDNTGRDIPGADTKGSGNRMIKEEK